MKHHRKATVKKTCKRTRFWPAQYTVKCYIDGGFITEYYRTGRLNAYALKRSFERTGICPAR
jgi:hypothetical protein